MAEPNHDFGSYMEEFQRAAAEDAADEAMYRSHDEWRRSTWAGWVVTQVLGFANHFQPFFQAVADAIAEDQSLGRRLISHFLRLSVVAVALIALYIVAKLAQTVIGEEIVSEQEIVIIEEIPRSRAEREGIVEGEEVLSAEAAKVHLAKLNQQQPAPASKGTRRNARDKKKKQ